MSAYRLCFRSFAVACGLVVACGAQKQGTGTDVVLGRSAGQRAPLDSTTKNGGGSGISSTSCAVARPPLATAKRRLRDSNMLTGSLPKPPPIEKAGRVEVEARGLHSQ